MTTSQTPLPENPRSEPYGGPASDGLTVRQLQLFGGSMNGLRSPCVTVSIDVAASAAGPQTARDAMDEVLDRLAQSLGEYLPATHRAHESPAPRTPARLRLDALLRLARLADGLQQEAGLPMPEQALCFVQNAAAPDTSVRPAVLRTVLLVPTLIPQQTAPLLGWLFDLLAEFRSDPAKRSLSEQRRSELAVWKQTLMHQAPPGTNNRHFIQAAYRLGMPLLRLAVNQYRYGWGRRARWLRSSLTDATPSMGVQIARDKALTNRLLDAAGLPVPPQIEVSSPEAALRAADKIGYPVVVKPADLDGGVGAKAGLTTSAQVSQAYEAARQHSGRVLVERHIVGNEYRLTVLHGKLMWAHQRVPAEVAGDGVLTLQSLVNSENARRGAALAVKPEGLKPITLDAAALEYLAEQGLNMDFVPAAGTAVRLQRVPIALTGGGGKAVTDDIHPDNAWLAERAARLLRMDIAGIDLIMPDITRSWREAGGAVTEVNAIPQMSNLTAADIHDRMLQQLVSGDGRIPVAVILGQAPHSDWLGQLVKRLQADGICAGMSTQGLTIGGQWVREKRFSAFADVCALQLDPSVGAIVLVTDGIEFLKTGLPFDGFDVLMLIGPKPAAAPEIEAFKLLLQYCRRQVLETGTGPANPRQVAGLKKTRWVTVPQVSGQTLDALLAAMRPCGKRRRRMPFGFCNLENEMIRL